MKSLRKHLKLIALFTLFLTFSFGCSKDDEGDKLAFMQAKVDGSLIICDSIVYLRKDLSGKLYGVEGYKKGNLGIMLQFPISKGVRTYQFLSITEEYENEGWLFYGFFNQYKSTNGSVTITEAANRKYKGTFSFTAENYSLGQTKEVTEGVFEIDD